MSRKGAILSGLVLFVATLALYGPTRSYGLLNLDDYHYLYGADGVLTKGFTLPALIWAFESLQNAIWMPLTWMSYMADFAFFGGDPGWMHLHNALLHAVNAVLVFALLGMMGPKRSGGLLAAVAAAAFWAWHPLRVEPVVWIASRKDVLSLFFELAALMTWIKRLDYDEGSRTAQDWRALSIAAFVLAGMAKPMAMTFPLLAVLLEYGKTGAVRGRDYTVPGAIGLVIAYGAIMAQRVGGATVVLQGVPLWGRLLNAMAAFGIYCWKTLYPVDLAVSCRNLWPELPRFWWQGILVCTGYGGVLLATGWRAFFHPEKSRNLGARTVFCALAFFLVAVGPTLGVSNFGHHAYADRFTYVPALGFSLLLAAAVERILVRRRLGRVLGGACGLLALGVLPALAHRQIGVWENGLTLFTQTLRVDGGWNIIALRSIGVYHYDYSHDLETALSYLDRAFAVNRKANETYQIIYILLLAEAGRLDDAKRELEDYRSLDLETRMAPPRGTPSAGRVTMTLDLSRHLAHAAIALAEGKPELARQYATRIVEVKPDETWANYLLGKMALGEGDTRGAVRYWKRSMAEKRQVVAHRFLAAAVERLEAEIGTRESGRGE